MTKSDWFGVGFAVGLVAGVSAGAGFGVVYSTNTDPEGDKVVQRQRVNRIRKSDSVITVSDIVGSVRVKATDLTKDIDLDLENGLERAKSLKPSGRTMKNIWGDEISIHDEDECMQERQQPIWKIKYAGKREYFAIVVKPTKTWELGEEKTHYYNISEDYERVACP